MCLCVRRWLYKQIFALNCRLQIEQVNSDCAESDDGPLALAFLSLRFLSASQMLFASNWETPLLMRQRQSDSISFPDICAKSAECYAGLHSSGCNLIINVHCSGESASKIGEFINNLKFLSIQSDGWFAVRLSRCWLVYYLSLFCANCEMIVVTCF